MGHVKNMLCRVARWTLRACLVAFIWLGLVPYFTVWIWRFYFWNADTTHYFFSRFFFPPAESQNQTASTTSDDKGSVWRSVVLDCMQGWLISTVVTCVFIAGFLLREWVLQNVPTELQDMDEEEQGMVEEEPEAPVVVAQDMQPQAPAPRLRRGRINHARRPPLQQEPSDYENLEAMWLMDASQASPPLHMQDNRAERHFFDLDQGSEQDDDDDEDDDGYFDESEPDEPVHPERVRDILDTIQRQQQQQQQQANIPNDQRVVDVHVIAQDDNIPQHQDDVAEANGGAGGAEDIDGILEVIGMKGSIYMLFQNSGLMTLLMSLCLGGGVWLPYTMGVIFITVSVYSEIAYATHGSIIDRCVPGKVCSC